MVAIMFRDAAHFEAWKRMGPPLPACSAPPLSSILLPVREVQLMDYSIPAAVVRRYQSEVGFANGHQIISRAHPDPSGAGPTLRASYSTTTAIANAARSNAPYGICVCEGNGSFRMLVEQECGAYQGLSGREVECLGRGRDTYEALGQAVIVHCAEKFMQHALVAMGLPCRPLLASTGASPDPGSHSLSTGRGLARKATGPHAARTISVHKHRGPE